MEVPGFEPVRTVFNECSRVSASTRKYGLTCDFASHPCRVVSARVAQYRRVRVANGLQERFCNRRPDKGPSTWRSNAHSDGRRPPRARSWPLSGFVAFSRAGTHLGLSEELSA